ncbi:MAG: hypothetical protein DI630_24320 [Gordonia sp. (in: high G+C Gram-positive bacteria)]|nr:MAG: hypothetical protein DI630_24320 [Gordonia sp. (in: high G+C Gram-positive bacteria)]
MSTPLKVTNRVPFDAQIGTDISKATDVSDALRIAGLDWGLIDMPSPTLAVFGEDGITNVTMPDRRLIVRDDTNVVLSAVGSRYVPLSNSEVYAVADHARALGAQFNSAGEINHGRSTFLTMNIPEATVNVAGHDPVSFKLVARTSNDGGIAFLSVSALRQVCSNGMTIGVGVPQTIEIRHSASATQRLQEAEQAMTAAMRYAKEFAARAEQLAATPMRTNEFDRFLAELHPRPAQERKAAHTRWETRRDVLMNLWAHSETNEEGRGTAWGALNALVEWADWFKPTRGGEEARALRQLDDTNAAIRQRAYRLLQPA